MDKKVITNRQIIGFLFISRTCLTLSSIPIVNFPPYNQDLWIVGSLSILYTLVFSAPLLFLANKFNEDTLSGYMEKIYGSFVGKSVAIIYGLYFIVNAINTVTLQTELIVTSILPDSPNIFVAGLGLIVCLYIVSKGIVTITRGLDIFTPLVIIIFGLLVLMGLNNIDYTVIFPILADSSLIGINKGAGMVAFLYTDIFLLVMVIPELKDKKSINKILVKSIVISLVFFIVTILVTQMTIGIEATRHSVFPFYKFTRLINLQDILERIDAVFVFMWIITSIVRISAYIYISVRVFREVFGKKEDEKVILSLVGLVIYIVSIFIIQRRPVIGIRKEFDLLFNVLFLIFVLAIPILTCGVYFLRRNSIKEKS